MQERPREPGRAAEIAGLELAREEVDEERPVAAAAIASPLRTAERIGC
jgi:hypothetical protein